MPVILRFLLIWTFDAVSIFLAAWIIPGIKLTTVTLADTIGAVLLTGLIISALNVVIRPLLVIVTFPINILTLGFFPLIINAFIFVLADYLLPFLSVNNFAYALLGSVLLMTINICLTGLLNLNRHYSFFDGSIQWLTARDRKNNVTQKGLVILEVDGLSFKAVEKAVDKGLMPSVSAILKNGTHKISSYDCGVPSQTSSSQAGIMYGDNWDIPAFRWYDKDRAKLISSNDNSNMAMIDERYLRGQGLLRGGSSINNLFSGDATNTVFTLSALNSRHKEFKARGFWYLNLAFLNPYASLQTALLTCLDIVIEFLKGVKQFFSDGPRINRWHSAYPLTRAFANILLRDVSTHMVVSDIIRGVPAIYTTYMGYDKVAHGMGPESKEALNILRGIDAQLDFIIDIVRRKAPFQYEVIILSDHGQSAGMSFKQRFGYTLTEYLHKLLKNGHRSEEPISPEKDNSDALSNQIKATKDRIISGWLQETDLNSGITKLHKSISGNSPSVRSKNDIVVCVGGNLANIYFTYHTGKICMSEIASVYPDFILSLIAHPGIGFIVAYQDCDTPVVLGNSGMRDLKTGRITGQDPLLPYGTPEVRAAQLLRLASFPHSGDIIVNSAVFENAEVAPFEEFLGSHGGLGGEQTEAFIIYPSDMQLPQDTTVTSLFKLLNSRR